MNALCIKHTTLILTGTLTKHTKKVDNKIMQFRFVNENMNILSRIWH